MKKFIILLLPFIFLITGENVFSQEIRRAPGKVLIHVNTGFSTVGNDWEYEIPSYNRGTNGLPDGEEWDVFEGSQKKGIFAEAGIEFSRPQWSLLLTFGVQSKEIHINDTDEDLKFNTNYSSLSFLYYIEKQKRQLCPFVIGSAGFIFRDAFLRYPGGMFSVGAGTKYYMNRNIGIEVKVERQLMKFNEIVVWPGIEGKITDNSFKFSIGIVYNLKQ